MRNSTASGLFVLGLCSLLTCCAQTSHVNQEKEMLGNITTSSSRVGQPDVAPVVFEGKRYEQVINGQREGLSQRTGFLSITDDKSNTRLATIKIYDVAFDERLEADVQDVFFITLKLRPEKRQLLIENEHGLRFLFDIDTRAVAVIE